MSEANAAAFKSAARAAGWRPLAELARLAAYLGRLGAYPVQNGSRTADSPELGGWKSYEMVKRYSHLSTEHLRAFVERKKGTAKSKGLERGGTRTRDPGIMSAVL